MIANLFNKMEDTINKGKAEKIIVKNKKLARSALIKKSDN